jgi:ketosteroid isomerase-like protein
MSRIALLEQLYDIFNREAFDEGEALIPADFVYHPPAQSLHPEPVGRQALADFLGPDLFERQSVELRELREQGDYVFSAMLARGTMSGAELQQPSFQVWRFEGDVPREVWTFTDRDEAERAAGLRD